MSIKPKNVKSLTKVPKIIWWCLSVIYASSAIADELDTFQFNASLNKTFDNNIFRQSSNEISDQVTVLNTGLKVDKSYSLQRLVADFNVVDRSYNQSQFLDFTAKNYDINWYWSLTPSFTGIIEVEQNQSMVDFRNFSATRRNIRTNKSKKIHLKYSPHQSLSFLAGVSRTDRNNSSTFNEEAGFETLGVDYGIDYKFRSGLSVGFLIQRRDADYADRQVNPQLAFDRGYQEREYEIHFSSPADSLHQLKGSLSRKEREFDTFSLRDYSGSVGELTYSCFVTGKLKVSADISRTISPFERFDSTFSQTDAFQSSLTYYISDKIQIGALGRISDRDFKGRGQFSLSGRSDLEHSYSGYVNWKPTRYASFNINIVKSDRESTVNFFDFDDRLVSVGVELSL
ncbi:XrtB/PEP-CTERM-associated polysaccharide biosynthesis outer membrane protein EpsL [Methylophilus sp.]|uniref:XrtB/PEP-CTERM-associated polysaccharide biosynthesis outer membrane protein EpsL n=1 Tax=Methylophilus sp. TaxID=29541 RepID=UPI000D4D6D2F|nr:XrtB/PEP-CTERM-associated polysaccharide biosynthesis outer membrane protein EpsL [Methylophilus sp.]PPD12395.1 MAG: hypothetical protein CTY26_05080 [Methylophilus sp.]